MSSSGGDLVGAPTTGAEGAQEPLTDKELASVRRLFSDPFAIPLEFKAWLVAFLEANPPYLVTGSIFGFKSALAGAIAGAPVAAFPGVIWAYTGNSDPNEHWMICDGRLLAITDYQKLFDIVGFQYSPTPGADPGGGKFHIPDGEGRTLVGVGDHADVSVRGKNDGIALSSGRSPIHNTSAHTHIVGREVVSLSPGGTSYAIRGNGSTLDSPSESTTPGPGGTRPTDMGAFLTQNWIIYVG